MVEFFMREFYIRPTRAAECNVKTNDAAYGKKGKREKEKKNLIRVLGKILLIVMHTCISAHDKMR